MSRTTIAGLIATILVALAHSALVLTLALTIGAIRRLHRMLRPDLRPLRRG